LKVEETKMAFDGFVVAALVREMNDKLLGGRLYKIAQPEEDELFITIKNSKEQYRLLLSASASLPLVYILQDNKPSPLTAPNFCMLLRKHISNGRIVSVTQPGLERIIRFEIEHLDEMGDLCKKFLIVELMGKHSNIIFCDENDVIIDSIKHIPAYVSSVREVLPGRPYFIPNTTGKHNPLEINGDAFRAIMSDKPMPVSKGLYSSFTGISPVSAEEICHLASIDGDSPSNCMTEPELTHLYGTFHNVMEDISSDSFSPCIVYKDEEPVEFSAIPLTMYADAVDKSLRIEKNSSISDVLISFYEKKNNITRIRQRSADLRQIVNTALERNNKKYDLQLKQLADTDKREKYRIYGELINTYGYDIPDGAKSFEALNYYTNEMITIPLQEDLTARENSIKYFERYNKLKRTYEALSKLTVETKEEIDHLESISNALDIAVSYDDLVQLKEEMIEYGYIHRKGSKNKREKITSRPFHYISSDGFHMYVGKNNYQNEELTFKLATGNDWWFHAKNIPGSHVIVKTENKELPDNTFEEAARLAAHYSKASKQEKVDVDYIQKKHIKKPAAAKPGFVIYHTNYSMTIDNDSHKMGTLVEE
jgi:predicted ribosome quality control (RQC) complex YloA/Tae2 family protein